MITITIDRAVVEQALEALELGDEWHPSTLEAITALRAALAQQAEPVVRGAAYADALRWTIKACGAVQRDDGVWFGDDAAARLARVLSEGIATPQQAEAVEPVAWMYPGDYAGILKHQSRAEVFQKAWCNPTVCVPLYTAPPQRLPLPNHDQHCVDVPGYGLMAVRLVRAVERAHGIGEGS